MVHCGKFIPQFWHAWVLSFGRRSQFFSLKRCSVPPSPHLCRVRRIMDFRGVGAEGRFSHILVHLGPFGFVCGWAWWEYITIGAPRSRNVFDSDLRWPRIWNSKWPPWSKCVGSLSRPPIWCERPQCVANSNSWLFTLDWSNNKLQFNFRSATYVQELRKNVAFVSYNKQLL